MTAPSSLRWILKTQRHDVDRLGVLSGTFNPPTRAHAALAEAALKQLMLDEVVFVLPQTPPHKDRMAASLEDRAAMLRLTVEGKLHFSAAITEHGMFLDIYLALKPEFAQSAKMIFLAGRDAAERILLNWPYPDPEKALEEMFAKFEMAVARRTGGDAPGNQFEVPPESPAAQHRSKIHVVELSQAYANMSASEVRKRVARGVEIETFVPAQIAQFIRERRLYASDVLEAGGP